MPRGNSSHRNNANHYYLSQEGENSPTLYVGNDFSRNKKYSFLPFESSELEFFEGARDTKSCKDGILFHGKDVIAIVNGEYAVLYEKKMYVVHSIPRYALTFDNEGAYQLTLLSSYSEKSAPIVYVDTGSLKSAPVVENGIVHQEGFFMNLRTSVTLSNSSNLCLQKNGELRIDQPAVVKIQYMNGTDPSISKNDLEERYGKGVRIAFVRHDAVKGMRRWTAHPRQKQGVEQIANAVYYMSTGGSCVIDGHQLTLGHNGKMSFKPTEEHVQFMQGEERRSQQVIENCTKAAQAQ